MPISTRIQVMQEALLSDNWAVLKKVTFRWLRRDSTWQSMHRECYNRGNGAVILPYDPEREMVLLTKQFRYPAFANGYDELLIECAAGMLDEAAPESRIRDEVEEELGYRLGAVQHVFSCFMSPGAVTERLEFFVAEYSPSMRVSAGGGLAEEGEDIEVLELPFAEAMAMIVSGAICDAKTVMLLQHLALTVFPQASAVSHA